MAKQVIWSPEAENDLTQILEFYYFKIGAIQYAKRLNQIIESEIEVIIEYPLIGKICNVKNVRVKMEKVYEEAVA